jgi:hypothetical protein
VTSGWRRAQARAARRLADQDVSEQVDAERAVAFSLHWGGDVAVDREPAGAVAGLGQASAEVGGDVDLEPVPGECVVAQHDSVVDRLADRNAVIEVKLTAPAGSLIMFNSASLWHSGTLNYSPGLRLAVTTYLSAPAKASPA